MMMVMIVIMVITGMVMMMTTMAVVIMMVVVMMMSPQWRGGLSEPGVDCETVDVEIVSIRNTEEEEEAKEKEEGEKAEKEEEEGNRNEECSVLEQRLCPTDAGLHIYPSLAANGAYCSLCLWDKHNASLNMVE